MISLMIAKQAFKKGSQFASDWRHHDAHIDGLVQERHNSIANALELRLSCTNRSIYIDDECDVIVVLTH